MLTSREINEIFEKAVKNSPELAKLFREHPERIEMYKWKIADVWDDGGGSSLNEEDVAQQCRACKTCRFAERSKPPFEKLPYAPYCMIYNEADSQRKPIKVYFGGEECEFYEKG